MQALITAFQGGGIFMWPIAIMLIIGTTICVERIYMILFVYETKGEGFIQKVQQCILDNNIDEAVKICNSRKQAALYKVVKSALINADRPFEEIQNHVEVATLGVVPKLQRRMPYLFTIANTATLLGLLGTIVGLVKTFEAVGAVEGSQKQLLLSAGISTAMNTTAFGLIVAIPCMLCYGFLFNRINTLVDDIDHHTASLLLLLRTGGEYFQNFSSEPMTSSQQDPDVVYEEGVTREEDSGGGEPETDDDKEKSSKNKKKE
jgi:biopolymer transport protein ExbB/TolQ